MRLKIRAARRRSLRHTRESRKKIYKLFNSVETNLCTIAAAKFHGVKPSDVTEEQRRKAKNRLNELLYNKPSSGAIHNASMLAALYRSK